VHVTTYLSSLVDPVLRGTVMDAEGQGGVHPDELATTRPLSEQSGSVTWCMDYRAFLAAYPSFPEDRDPASISDHECLDLTVEVERGVLTSLDLAGLELPVLLDLLGQAEAARAAAALVGRPVEDAGPAVARLLGVVVRAGS
jgi:hypothetical protein